MKNNKFTVYMHIAPNNKKYIGITKQEPNIRWKNGKAYKTCLLFDKAIKKYGWENINHKILFTNLTKEEAELKEIELIAKYKTTNSKYGYNIENGGNTIGKHSEKTKQKIGKANKGKKRSDEQKERLRQINLGKKMSEEAKEKMSLAHKGKTTWNKGISPSEETRLKISLANKGRTSWIKGKHWTDEHNKEISKKLKGRVSPMKGRHQTEKAKLKNATAIICVETGEHFYSIRDAERKTGLQRTGIMGVLKGKYKQTGGMTFEYTKK